MRLLGSAGMADLAPLGDLAAELFADVELAPREALVLVNNNSFATGFAALALAHAARLADSMTVAAALDLEAFAANLGTLDAEVARVRPYGGLRDELRRLRAALDGSHLWSPGAASNPRTSSPTAASRTCGARRVTRSASPRASSRSS